MSQFIDRLTFFRRVKEPFSGGHGILTHEDRAWEDSYRHRWQYDKVGRSTHGVNCTGSCSWKIYVKGGIVTWETQQTDYPRTRPDLPNHEPRGCQRGASYSWYLYSGSRLKYPLIRGRLLKFWREARQTLTPVAAWKAIMQDPEKRAAYQRVRGMGGFVRASWAEANEMVAAANSYTIKEYGPDRVVGFSPIPAMSMVSFAAGSRYLNLIGGTCLSFYDWYCDLPPSSPQTFGEQTDVPESADWFNSQFLIVWGSNIPQTRTPDAHFLSEARYHGTKVVAVTPDYSEVAKFADVWLAAKQGTDSAMAMAMGHVILREFYLEKRDAYFEDYVRRLSDMPLLVCLDPKNETHVAGRLLRASDLLGNAGEENNPEWKTIALDENTGDLTVPRGSVGFRWGEKGLWNLEAKDSKGSDVKLALSLADKNVSEKLPAGRKVDFIEVDFPYFGDRPTARHVQSTGHGFSYTRRVPALRLATPDGEKLVTTVFDLMCAHYGLDRGFGGGNVASSYDEDVPFTPAWQEKVTGVPRQRVIDVARGFAKNASETEGKSMVIVGAGLNHWYHCDMSYRAIINMLVFCGCIGKSGGGWTHYVGQEKLRPLAGWAPIAFAADWSKPPRLMNGTSFFYAHSDQWRYETLKVSELLAATAPEGHWSGSLIDYNYRSERMGWSPSAPQLNINPLSLAGKAKEAGKTTADYLIGALKSGEVKFAISDPDNPVNWPRNLFLWRSNLLGASGKGHEYFLKHLLGAPHGVLGKDLGVIGEEKPEEVVWREHGPEGKLDLLVVLDFRVSTSGLYADILLPTASFYEKNDLNTSDMHPFIHPFTAAVDPVWESRSDWQIFRGFAKEFSRVAPEVLGTETDTVLTPMMHDSPDELGQAFDPEDWTKGEVDPKPGVTMPFITEVERDYAAVGDKFTALGPLLDKLGNGIKGIKWGTEKEIELLRELNGTVRTGPAKGRPLMDNEIEAAETILTLAPETNGEVAIKAWTALSQSTGREHAHLALKRGDDKIRFHDIVEQPRKIITAPTWSGIESEEVSYNAGYTNVHELIPWRTVSGRMQLYQDHQWMRAFGEQLVTWKPPVNMLSLERIKKGTPGEKEVALNWVTPHQKWGIHTTYSDNLIMLTLNRGGPCIWISEIDAAKADIVDNDWIECYNQNGCVVGRAVVSQRIPEGLSLMYHAQEKTINVPGTPLTGQRGGVHNSATRIVINPVHLIGGYAQLAYSWNYYGAIGSQRDEYVIVRKLNDVDWLDRPAKEVSVGKEVAV